MRTTCSALKGKVTGVLLQKHGTLLGECARLDAVDRLAVELDRTGLCHDISREHPDRVDLPAPFGPTRAWISPE